jgi:nucleoside 2-deoxyribosyltransferase
LTVYFAAPLFTQAERQWNQTVVDELVQRVCCTVILPQQFDLDAVQEGQGRLDDLFRQCIEGVDACDVVVAVLDGPDGDSGTAFEMGYACARGKPVIGVRTDFREQHDQGTNIMLSHSCGAIVRVDGFRQTPSDVANAVTEALHGLTRRRSGCGGNQDGKRSRV